MPGQRTEIAYSSGVDLGDTTVNNVGTGAEVDISIITAPERLKKSQLNLFLAAVFGGSTTSVAFRFYALMEAGGTWFEIVKQNASDNTLDDWPAIIDGSTPSKNVVFSLPLPSCVGFKVTAIAAGATATSVRAKIMGRDN